MNEQRWRAFKTGAVCATLAGSFLGWAIWGLTFPVLPFTAGVALAYIAFVFALLSAGVLKD